MKAEKIYQDFPGYLPDCPGEKCASSQCEKASRQGVEIFPDEVIFLKRKFKSNLPVDISFSWKSKTGFLMKNCSKNKECLLKDARPIFCRTFPVKPYFFSSGHCKISTYEKCPLADTLPDDFFSGAAQIWEEALRWKNRNFLKKLVAVMFLGR